MPLVGFVKDESIFPILNFVFIGYVFLIFFPRLKFTKTITLVIPCIYSALYLGLVVDWIKNNPDKTGTIDFSSLKGVINLFSDHAAVMAGWTHYIAFDLMVARFIIFDAQDVGISHFLVVPLVPLTLMLGPIGLFVYLILKTFRELGLSKSLYGLTLMLCSTMVIIIFIFPGSYHFAFPSISSAHKMNLENAYVNSPVKLPVTILTKYFNHPIVTAIHVIPAGLWSFIVPFQLIPQLRSKAPFFHRLSGYIMLSTVPFIVIGVGLIFIKKLDFEYDFPSHFSEPVSELGLSPFKDSFLFIRMFMGVIAIYFVVTALLALKYARAKNFQLHRKWIIRHIAAGIWVALQRWYLVFRYPTTLWTARAAFYDGVFIAIGITLSTAEFYLWFEDSHKISNVVHDDMKLKDT
mmetsp:Transcript_28961/g.39784  ORF Transcript_28961/g.39784 Transcript_28961/m.39784 type:complete len:406 (-) Transcript_28961:19-1236(-)